MRTNNHDERETYSDSDLVTQDEKLRVCNDSLFMESLQLESCEVAFVSSIPFKTTRRLFIPKVLQQYSHLQATVLAMKKDVQAMASEIIFLEDQTSILSMQVKTQRSDIKKLKRELVGAQHIIDQYRQVMQKYNISDISLLETLSSRNQQLKEELGEQRKQTYTLQQELYRVSREYEALRSNNQQLSHLVEKKALPYKRPKDTWTEEKTKKVSLWQRFLKLFRRKKGKKKMQAPSTPRKKRSTSSPMERITLHPDVTARLKNVYSQTFSHSTSDTVRIKDDLRLLKQAGSHPSANTLRKKSSSSTNSRSVTQRVSRGSTESANKSRNESVESVGDPLGPSYQNDSSGMVQFCLVCCIAGLEKRYIRSNQGLFRWKGNAQELQFVPFTVSIVHPTVCESSLIS